MNERINELAKSAGLKFPSETALSPAEEKFAQLIVQECIAMSTGQNQYKLGFQLAKDFSNHFGVK